MCLVPLATLNYQNPGHATPASGRAKCCSTRDADRSDRMPRCACLLPYLGPKQSQLTAAPGLGGVSPVARRLAAHADLAARARRPEACQPSLQESKSVGVGRCGQAAGACARFCVLEGVYGRTCSCTPPHSWPEVVLPLQVASGGGMAGAGHVAKQRICYMRRTPKQWSDRLAPICIRISMHGPSGMFIISGPHRPTPPPPFEFIKYMAL